MRLEYNIYLTPFPVLLRKQVEFRLDLWDEKHLVDVLTEVSSCSDAQMLRSQRSG